MSVARQSSLFGIEPRPLPGDDDGVDRDRRAAEEQDASNPGQIDLFADRACLARDLEAALRGGDFPEANRLRLLFEETYGESADTRALSFLEGEATALSSAQPEVALPAWRTLDSSLESPRLRRILQEGVLRRLLREHPAEKLAASDPASLPALAWTLTFVPEGAAERDVQDARGLVRTALLAGQELSSLDFRWDEPLADLLAEGEPPAWLPSLGVVRRLWPAPRPTPEDLAALSSPFDEPESPDTAAHAFWSCLRVAEDSSCPEPAVHEARRRMKKLRPDLHALYMRRALV